MARHRGKMAVVVLALCVLATSCVESSRGAAAPSDATGEVAVGSAAPEFPDGLTWAETTRPLSLDQLEGKIVIAYFWTASCLTCVDLFDDLDRLQADHPDEVVVLGIHSGRFSHDTGDDAIRGTLSRYGVKMPVVNDASFGVWNAWGMKSWPTAVVIDGQGTVVGGHTGTGLYLALRDLVGDEVQRLRASGGTDASIVVFPTTGESLPPTVLSFPGDVVADVTGGRLFIADTNNNRVIVADIDSYEVIAVVGGGEVGHGDGPFETAAFDEPRGLALDSEGARLYVADTGNHMIRVVDLDARVVGTVAGTGERSGFPPVGGEAQATPLSYPWDLALAQPGLYISMAGSNQLWLLDLGAGQISPSVGSAVQGFSNGPATEAELARPAGLDVADDGRIFFADSESSTVRWADGPSDGLRVDTLAGGSGGFYDFGDIDGPGVDARFQRPLGVAADRETVWVADTYNSKIKRIDPSGSVTTLVGGEGWRDGLDPLFSSPEGIDVAGPRLYVADTGNHSVRVVDATTGETTTVVLKGIERLEGTEPGEDFEGTELTLDVIDVAPGPGKVRLDVTFPDGYKANELAPSRFEWRTEGGAVVLPPDADRSIAGPVFPLELEASFVEGAGSLRAEVWLVYCEVEAESICLFDRAVLTAPVEVADGGPAEVTLPYAVELPEGLS